MAKMKVTGIKGMPDMLPEDSAIWEKFTDTVRAAASGYGYRQIRTPILESTALFTRGIGEVTDIVEKEMYSFEDSMNGEKLTLRPENTSAVVRAAIEHSLTYNAPQRLWYFGPMFRHERPQRGRYRQFHQFGCEALGFAGPDVDVELLAMITRIWKNLGITARLELNSLGEIEERAKHREALIAYFQENADVLDEDAKRRLLTNPLRILDTKNPDMQDMVNAAPKLLDFLGEKSLAFLAELEKGVSAMGIEYTVNPRLVRGLDYYNHTIFEFITTIDKSELTICAGGRYDSLVEYFGGPETAGVGFGLGLERLLLVLDKQGIELPVEESLDVYIAVLGSGANGKALELVQAIRYQGFKAERDYLGRKIKAQFKSADTFKAKTVITLGESEVESGQVNVKNNATREEVTVSFEELTKNFAVVLEQLEK